MKNGKIYDYNIVTAMQGVEQKETENNVVLIYFNDCKFEIRISKFEESEITINKTAFNHIANSDQIKIMPVSSNQISIG